MGRKRSRKPSISGFFRNIFTERPELLDATSNDELKKLWLAAHPNNKDIPKSVKQNLANTKSNMRKKLREGKPGAAARASRNSSGTLATLEEAVDDCMTLAKNIDRAGLKGVIEHLRTARNIVVWKMGK